MKKVDAISYVLVAISVVVMVIFIVYKIASGNVEAPKVIQNVAKRSTIRNSSYTIRGEKFYLVNGMATKVLSSGSGTKQTVKIAGVPVSGDLNGDDMKDTAVILSSVIDKGGVSHYASFAIASGTAYKTTDALYLGTGGIVESVEIDEGNALYIYRETKYNEQKATTTTIIKNIIVHYDSTSNSLGELVKDFEGEADPDKMTLHMKKWAWQRTVSKDGTTVVPKKEGVFSITFTQDKTVNIKTDCNAMIGRYAVEGNVLTFGEMASTKMYCEDSQEQIFAETVRAVKQFVFTSKGELLLETQDSKEMMIFK